MDNEYRLKNNRLFHSELTKQHKIIRWQKLDAPKNPFEAAAASSSRRPAKVPRIDTAPDETNSGSCGVVENMDTNTRVSVRRPAKVPRTDSELEDGSPITDEPSTSRTDNPSSFEEVITDETSPSQTENSTPFEELTTDEPSTSRTENWTSFEEAITDKTSTSRTENPTSFEEAITDEPLTTKSTPLASIEKTLKCSSTILTQLTSCSHGKQSSYQPVREISELHQPRTPESFKDRGKGARRFQVKWFDHDDWKTWLHYDQQMDAAFCFTCITATKKNLLTNRNAETAFISSGYSNWSDAGTKGRGFDQHCRSETHQIHPQRNSK